VAPSVHAGTLLDSRPMVRVASCSCGQLKASCRGEPHRISMCHCLACQKRTGSVFGVQAWFREEDVTIEGTSTEWQRVGDEGGKITCHFCPRCSSIVHYRGSYAPGAVGIPVGAFADPSFPPPKVSVYESRRHPWTEMPRLDLEHID
jgi:hypothetical protein